MYFSLSLWRNDNRGKLWPCSLFKVTESRGGLQRNPAQPRRSWASPADCRSWVGCPTEMKDHQPQVVWAAMFRKWKIYSLLPDLNKNKPNPNNSHSAITATWHYPAHRQCRVRFASETGAGNVFYLYGTWVNGKCDDKWVSSHRVWISNAYSSGASHSSQLSQRAGMKQCPCRTSECK